MLQKELGDMYDKYDKTQKGVFGLVKGGMGIELGSDAVTMNTLNQS